MPSHDARAALEEILAKGRLKQRQKWVALGGRLVQEKRNLSYEEIREIAKRDDKKGLSSGYSDPRTPYISEPQRQRRKSA